MRRPGHSVRFGLPVCFAPFSAKHPARDSQGEAVLEQSRLVLVDERVEDLFAVVDPAGRGPVKAVEPVVGSE